MSCFKPILESYSGEAFGYYITERSQRYLYNIQSNETKVNNLINFLGYIPLVGILIGIIRILMTNDASHVGFKNAERVRAGFEIAGCGLLLLIPDLIMTLYRNVECCKPSRTYQPVQ